MKLMNDLHAVKAEKDDIEKLAKLNHDKLNDKIDDLEKQIKALKA